MEDMIKWWMKQMRASHLQNKITRPMIMCQQQLELDRLIMRVLNNTRVLTRKVSL